MTAPFFEAAYAASERPARLLDADAELFEDLSDSAARALADVAVSTLRLQPGRWTTFGGIDDDRLALLVLDGVLVRTVDLAGQRRSELIGAGDLISASDSERELASVSFDVEWDVLLPARLGVLDASFFAAASRCPELAPALIARGVRRSHRLALQHAISDLRHIDERLIALFLHLGDRWGHMTRDGIHVPLRLTHDVIAQLVGAQRPTVTTGLNDLQRAGRLERRADRTWVVTAPSLAETG